MNRWLGWMVAGWISGILAAEISWWCVVPVIMTAAWVLKRQGARVMSGAPWGDDRIAASMAQPPAVPFFRRDRTWLKPILCMVMIPMACHRTQMTTTEQTKWMEMTTNMTIRTIMAYGQILEEPRAVSSNRVDLLVAVHRIQTGSYNRQWIHLDHPVPARISILKRRDAYTLKDWLPHWLTRAYRLTNPGLMPDAPSIFTPAWRKELLYGRDISFMASVGRYTNRKGGIGFLLSFGAVLSLVLLTSPIMGWMESLAGWRLAGFMLWVAGWLGLAAWNADAAVSRGVVLAFVAGGFVLMKALLFLPESERFAFTRLPKAVQSLLAAQGAIQLGVMIPLSGRFFGDYSFAGITANLVGIPLAGVYIPAAVGFALLGLVPGAGPVMANTLAPVVSAMGGALLETASWATVAWASPSVPAWPWWGLGAYYAVLAVALVGAKGARSIACKNAHPRRPCVAGVNVNVGDTPKAAR